MLRWSRWRIVHSAPGSQIVRSASAPTRIVPLRGKRPKVRAGFSESARAIQVGGSPRLTTPSFQTSGASVSSDGAPNGMGTPCASTKMFVVPGSLNFGRRGAWSLAIVWMAPAAEPAHIRSEEHTSELQSRLHLVCRLLLEKKKKQRKSQLSENNIDQKKTNR